MALAQQPNSIMRFSLGALFILVAVVCADFAYREFNSEFRAWKAWKADLVDNENLLERLYELCDRAKELNDEISAFESEHPNFTDANARILDRYRNLMNEQMSAVQQARFIEVLYYRNRWEMLEPYEKVPNVDDIVGKRKGVSDGLRE